MNDIKSEVYRQALKEILETLSGISHISGRIKIAESIAKKALADA